MGDPKSPPPEFMPLSTNEPPGSAIGGPAPDVEPDAAAAAPALDPLPSDSELMAMTRAQLDDLAASRGLDSTTLSTKADVIAYLHSNE